MNLVLTDLDKQDLQSTGKQPPSPPPPPVTPPPAPWPPWSALPPTLSSLPVDKNYTDHNSEITVKSNNKSAIIIIVKFWSGPKCCINTILHKNVKVFQFHQNKSNAYFCIFSIKSEWKATNPIIWVFLLKVYFMEQLYLFKLLQYQNFVLRLQKFYLLFTNIRKLCLKVRFNPTKLVKNFFPISCRQTLRKFNFWHV